MRIYSIKLRLVVKIVEYCRYSRALLFVFATGLFAATALAQSSAKAPVIGDTAWANISDLSLTAVTNKPNSSVKSPTQVATDKQKRATDFQQVSRAAKDFYTQYPTHPHAAAAKKLEATSAIEGITDGDKVHEQTALKVANDYRIDRKNPPADRFEVAHAIERQQVGRKLAGRHYLTSPVEAEKMADRLRKEFGDSPEVHALYLNIAENTNCDNGADVARKILQLPASPAVKTAARQVLERRALVGKPLDIPLTSADGRVTKLNQLAGQRTVICVWPGDKQPGGPPGLRAHQQQASPGIQWVYVSLGAIPATSRDAIKSAAPAGTTFVEPLGMRSPLATRLKITQLPFVYVLDERKNVTGFGRIDDLAALLSRPNRLIEP